MKTIAEFRAASMEKFEAHSHELNARAKTNIERYRKGDRTLRILNKDGTPVVGARVRITQRSHDFKHGANLFLLDEFGEGDERNQRYRDQFAAFFDLATVPFYWDALEPEEGKPRYAADSAKIYRRPAPDLCMDYCKEKGIDAKLHCLFYDRFIPTWLPMKDADAMWRLYEKRFAEIADRYAGKMHEIEVTNEILVSHNWKTRSVLSDLRDTPLRMWQMARRYFPDEKLVVNDTKTLPYIGMEGYRHAYVMFLEGLLSKGATVDKIGIQHHMFCGMKNSHEADLPFFCKYYFDPVHTLRGLEILSELGKPLEITEVTVPTFGDGEDAEQLQADMLRIFYTMWFSTPQMENVVYWNTADGMAWADPTGAKDENNVRGGLFHNDMTPKLAALELKRLFDEEWHTEESLVTDENGCVTFRGFFGNYTAEVEGREHTFGLHRGQPTCADILL